MHHTPRLLLSATAKLSGFASTDAPRRYWKEVLKVGDYIHPTQKFRLSVDRDRITRMADTFRRLHSAGVSSDITVDHSQSARDKYGRLSDAKVEGDSLYLLHEFADDEGVKLAERVGETSLEIEPEYVDSHGNKYADAIVANSIVRQPVIPGQSPFVRIAASRSGDADDNARPEIGMQLWLDAESPSDSEPNRHTTAGDQGMDIKLTDQQVKDLGAITGLEGDKLTADALVPELLKLSRAGKEAGDQSKTLEAEKGKVQKLSRQVDELKGQLPNQPTESEKQLQDQMLDMERERVEEKADNLVRLGRITQDVANEFKAQLKDADDKPNRVMLSRSGGKSNALSLLTILEKNDPSKLVKTGQATGAQGERVSLGRNVPDGDNDEAELDELDKRVRARAGAKV